MNERYRKHPNTGLGVGVGVGVGVGGRASSSSTPSTPSGGPSSCNLLIGSGAVGPVGGGRGFAPGAVAEDVTTGIQDETVLLLVFQRLNWDPRVVCVAACVSRRLRAVARRVLFRELCISRAPRMVSALTAGGAAPGGRLGGGWHALAKLLFFCSGCPGPSRFFPLDPARRPPTPGHFAGVSRFSKTSGRSFLARRCWGDLLYVSDPCEHPAPGGGGGGAGDDDLGAYRGVFRAFMRSKTRAWLIGKQAELETRVRCPYCGARVWSMTAAGLVPRSASRRLGTHEGSLEYFVCVNGHLHGYCWLAHLSTDEEGDEEDLDYDDDEEEEAGDGADDEDDGHIAF